MSPASRRRPRVGVIHAALGAIPVVESAFRAEFPEAVVRVTLDNGLILDVPDDGLIPRELAQRLERLIDFVLAGGVDGLLVACSSYPDVVDDFVARTRPAVPVLKADEALFAELADRRFTQVGILLTFPGAVRPTRTSLDLAYAARALPAPSSEIRCLAEAGALLADGQAASAHQLLADAAWQLRRDGAQAIALGQYSLAGAAPVIESRTALPVFAGSTWSAIAMRRLLLGEGALPAARAG